MGGIPNIIISGIEIIDAVRIRTQHYFILKGAPQMVATPTDTKSVCIKHYC